MEPQITEQDKMIAREVKRVVKIDDNFKIGEMNMQPGNPLFQELRRKNRQDLIDYLTEFSQKEGGMTICEILQEVEIDDKYAKELKQLEEELKEVDFK